MLFKWCVFTVSKRFLYFYMYPHKAEVDLEEGLRDPKIKRFIHVIINYTCTVSQFFKVSVRSGFLICSKDKNKRF